MFIAADFGTGQVLWSIFWFFLFLLWVWLVISVFSDIIRSDDLSGAAKAIWTIAIILFPYVGVFAYLLTHGGSMGERATRRAREQEAGFETYIRDVAGVSTADELEKLARLRHAGVVDDAEYRRLKEDLIERSGR